MGVYTKNRTNLGSYDFSNIVADESYIGLAGASRMLLENVQNEQMMFDAVVANDFTEVGLALEGADSQIYALQEASMSGILEKIKSFFKKIVEKIKGLFHSFMARINGVIIRDNKELLTKYKNEIIKKDCSNMKYKWSEPKSKLDKADMSVTSINESLNGAIDSVFAVVDSNSDDKTIKSLEKIQDKISDNTILEEALGNVIKLMGGGSGRYELSEFDKEFHDCCFEEQDVENELKDSRKTYIMNVLSNARDSVKTANKFIQNTEKLSKQALKRIDDENKKYIKAMPKDGDKTAYDAANGDEYDLKMNNLYSNDKEGALYVGAEDNNLKISTYNKILNTVYSMVSQCQTMLTRTSAAWMKEVQFDIKQARRVWVQAAAYRPKANKEDMNILFDAIDESVDYEVSSDFEMLTI